MSNYINKVTNMSVWRLNLMNTSYLIKDVQSKSVEDIQYEFMSILKDHNMKNDRRWLNDHKRSCEIHRPLREKELFYREKQRQKDRHDVAFMCRYVLSSKGLNLPKK